MGNFRRRNRHKHRPQVQDNYVPDASQEIMNKPVTELNFSKFTLEAFVKGRINTVGDILVRTERDMFKLQGFGKRNLEDVRKELTKLGVNFKSAIEPEQRTTHNVQRTTADSKNKATPPPPKPTGPGTPEEWQKYNEGGKFGFKNLLGEKVIPAQFDELFLFKDGLACFEKQGDFGYINEKGETVIEPQFECAMSFSEGLAAVTRENKSGYINKTGELVIPYKYDAATPFEEGTARVKSDNAWHYILPDGKTK